MSNKRQNYSFWRFFNKNGDNFNFTYDEALDKWTGVVYLDRVSAGLIEYSPIYILEDTWDGVNNQFLGLRKPKKANLTPWCPGATSTNILAVWKDNVRGTESDNVDEIFLWQFEGYPGPDPYLVKLDSLDIDLGTFSGDLVGPSGGGATGQLVQGATSTPFIDEALSIRVGLQSMDEDSYSRTLQLIDPNYLTEDSYSTFGCTGSTHVFAEITFYGETEGEDTRLETMIENFGTAIKNTDFKIFDDTDVNEALPDFIKLNSKRKELLLEWDNIFPFTGSYKALINILKYFGYDQVTLKEYWLNIEELKGNNPEGIKRIRYRQTPIVDLFSTNPKTSNTTKNIIPSKVYKKTSKFGLFYDITRDSGEFDNDGIPIVEEAFLFSNEEVLIKLFALKQKLKNYFLPLNARIVDIVGEAVYYARYDVNIWRDLIRVDDVELNTDPCIKISPDSCFSMITDLTPDNFIGVKIPPDLNASGITDFVTYAIGVTYTNTTTGLAQDLSGFNDKFTIVDSVSGASFSYFTPEIGMTAGEVVDGIIAKWNSLTEEPWTSFTPAKNANQDITNPSPSYSWFYAVQTDIIGSTGGVGFTASLSVTPGSTSGVYYNPGGTYLGSIDWSTSPISEYSSAFMGWFNDYNKTIKEINDYPCAPIAAPFVLENCTFDINWDQLVINWNSADYVDLGTGIGTNYSQFTYTYTEESYPLGTANPYSGYTGPTYSGPAGGTFAGGATPGNPLHPPGPTYVPWITGITGPTANPILYNWNNIAYGNFYELQWIITYDQDPSYVIDSGLLSLEEGRTYPILLKYAGTYTVELYLYDSLGGYSKITETSKLRVDTKDVDFLAHYNFRELDYKWYDKTLIRQSDIVPAPKKLDYPIWDVYNSTWDLPLQENEQFSMQDLTYNDLDMIEFYQTQNDPQYQGFCSDVLTLPQDPGVSGSTGLYDLDAYKWNLIEGNSTWNDVYHLWWNSMLPKVSKITIDYPTGIGLAGGIGVPGTTAPTMAIVKGPLYGKPTNIELAPDFNTILSMPNPPFGLIVKNMDPGATGITNVWQYYGGPTGATGASSWKETTTEVDTFTFTDLTNGGTLSGNNIWKEFVRQINEELYAYGASHNNINEFIPYYQEEYTNPTNPLDPKIEFVTKEFELGGRYFLKLFGNSPTYTPINIYDVNGATANYGPCLDMYWSNYGDIPFFVEIFAVGPSGGMIWLPGVTSTGPTHFGYAFGATNLEDLGEQLINTSKGLTVGGTGPKSIVGPILDYEWNIVYGASGYTGPTGSTAFPPPSSLAAIKVQGYKKYFSSNDYACIYFTGLTGVTGATSHVLGGDTGIAGTMCGRSITNNSTWDTLRIHKYAKEFPLLTQLHFNYSESTMDGKVSPTWELIKENDDNWENIYYNNPYFSYLFTQKGSYTINLTIEDGNGNTKTKTKKEFVKII